MKLDLYAVRKGGSGLVRADVVFRWAFLLVLVAALFISGTAFGTHVPSLFKSGSSISHWIPSVLGGAVTEPGFDHEAVLESLPTVGIIGLCIIVGVCILAGAFIIMRK